MTRRYSVDLHERVVRTVEAGLSRRATAGSFGVSVSFVIKLMQRWRCIGTVAPDQYGGWKRSALAVHAERVRALLAATPAAQQARFDAFCHDVNHQRPHQALGQQPPASLWRPSPR